MVQKYKTEEDILYLTNFSFELLKQQVIKKLLNTNLLLNSAIQISKQHQGVVQYFIIEVICSETADSTFNSKYTCPSNKTSLITKSCRFYKKLFS